MVDLWYFILYNWKWNGGNRYSHPYVDIFKAENNFHGHLGTVRVVSTKFQSDKPYILLCYEVIDCVI